MWPHSQYVIGYLVAELPVDNASRNAYLIHLTTRLPKMRLHIIVLVSLAFFAISSWSLIIHPERQTNSNNILRRINARKFVQDLKPINTDNKDLIDNVEVTRKSFGVNNKFTRRRREASGGFTKFSEMLNGRIAMAAFTVGLVREAITGESLLQQIGLHDQKCGVVFISIMSLIVGGFLQSKRKSSDPTTD